MSGLELVPQDHIEFLISKTKGLSDRKRAELVSDAAKPNGRAKVLDELEATGQHPDLRARLGAAYDFYSRVAIHLWTCPCLEGVDLRALSKKGKWPPKGGAWKKFPNTLGSQVGEQPRRMRFLEDGRLRIVVSVNKVKTMTHEDTEVESLYTTPITVLLDAHSHTASNGIIDGTPIAEAFGSESSARKAVRAILQDLFEQRVPDRFYQEHMERLTFGQSDVKRLRDNLKLSQNAMDGPHPSNRFGEQAIRGVMNGRHREALDETDPLVKEQDAAPNKLRHMNYVFRHPADGFEERCEVTFHLGGRHPHVSFRLRTSNAAMRWILDNLRATIMSK